MQESALAGRRLQQPGQQKATGAAGAVSGQTQALEQQPDGVGRRQYIRGNNRQRSYRCMVVRLSCSASSLQATSHQRGDQRNDQISCGIGSDFGAHCTTNQGAQRRTRQSRRKER